MNHMKQAELHRFPETGISHQDISHQLDEFRASMTSEHAGKFASTAFWGIESTNRLVSETFNRFFSWNALFTFQEAAAARMENEVIDICIDLAGGDETSRANLTSGGTESNFCGLYAMRGWARERHPEIKQPEIIAPYSIHSTVHKAARILDIRVVTVPQNNDLSADVKAMKAAIGPDTIGIACSAPSWPYGRVDPVGELGQITIEHNLWLHVDACVGGFLLPFFRELGQEMPDYDLAVPGVRSMTMDLHKYAFAPKPCSVVLWHSQEEQRHHFIPVSEWPCDLYLSQSFVGTRPLAPIASAWALFHHLGKKGYRDHAGKILEQRNRLVSAVKDTDGLVTWPSHGPLLQIAPDGLNIKLVAGEMQRRGWNLLGVNHPPAIHLTIDVLPEEILQRFIDDLQSAAADAKSGKLKSEGDLNYAGVGDENLAPKWLQSAIEILQREQQ